MLALALTAAVSALASPPRATTPARSRAQEPETTPLARDPDRGLDPTLRERLSLADPARGEHAIERRAARVAERLALVARSWGEGRLDALAAEPWIARDLRVAPLDSTDPARALARGAWSLGRGPAAEGERGDARPLAAALSAWRAAFGGESRLELEVLDVEGDEPELAARVRLSASGASGGGRAQHDATWRTAWRALEDGALALEGVAVESFESAALAGLPGGLYSDVTESALAPELWRGDLARGLDEWRLSIPAALEPGSLGHHGLALGDADGDGREDVYLCRPGGLPNRLLLRRADDGLEDASAASGADLLDYSSSALLLDLDGDEDADLCVGTGSGLVLFENTGRARFERRQLVERSLPTSLAAADFDADGDLDVYACGYVSPYEQNGTPLPYHDANNGEENALLRNDGEWRFVDATVEVGLGENNRRFSLGAGWEDFDEDGDADLYVANDFGVNNLYRNDGGRFRDVAAELGALDVSAGMGVTWGDVGNDGWMDLYVTNMHSPAGARLTARDGFRPGSAAEVERAYRAHATGNTLLLSERGARLRDAADSSGTARGRWGWGSIFLDLDSDGELDLLAPNGFVTGERGPDLDSFFWREVVLRSPEAAGGPDESYRLGWRAVRRLIRQGYSWNGAERNAVFLGLGGGRFADVSGASGLDLADDARAAARIDWDGDGDEDVLLTSRTAPMLRLLRNESPPGRWIAFELSGAGRTAVGARVSVACSSGRTLSRSLQCGEGYLAQSSARVRFGLGADEVEAVSVRWPGGETESFGAPAANAAHALVRGSGRATTLAARATPSRLAPGSGELPAPSGAARTVLPVPLPLPRLALETEQGVATSLLGITMQGPRGTGSPLLLVVWSAASAPCLRELERLAKGAESLAAAGVQVLALNADPPAERERARAALGALAWPHRRGFASEEALHVLELVQGALHDDARALALPAAFLVDPGGRLASTYRGRVEPARVAADVALFALSPEERRDACVPFPGRWLGPPPGPFDQKVAARLAEHGLERPAGEYRLAQVEVRGAPDAQALYERGVTAQQQKHYAEAVTQYRAALELDPGHLRAAQNLAVALHQAGEREAALSAYLDALRLDPGHALSRSNLGHLYVELGRLEDARAQLAALERLGSELAARLEQRITAAGG